MTIFVAFSLFQANVNGRVLSQCNIDELKKEMNMNFGDWQLFRASVSATSEPSARSLVLLLADLTYFLPPPPPAGAGTATGGEPAAVRGGRQ